MVEVNPPASTVTIIQDVITNRPSAGIVNRLFYATDENRWYRDDGMTWQKLDTDTVDNKHIPNTISNILTDHNLSNHESLGLKKITIGISSSRPSAGLANELYIETDTNIIYRGTGTSWQEIGRNIGFDFPNTISNILTDHNKTNHDNLLIDADTVDGIDIPNTISNILTDHNKTNHDNLLIDADTVDGLHASELGGSKSFVDHLPWCLL